MMVGVARHTPLMAPGVASTKPPRRVEEIPRTFGTLHCLPINIAPPQKGRARTLGPLSLEDELVVRPDRIHSRMIGRSCLLGLPQ